MSVTQQSSSRAYLLLQLLTIERCERNKATVNGDILRRDNLRVVVGELRRDLDELARGGLILTALQLAETRDNLQLCCGKRVLVGSGLGFGYIVVNMREVVQLDGHLSRSVHAPSAEPVNVP